MTHRIMTLLVTSAFALALQPASAQIRLAGITEARGPGATAGQSLKSGYLMAIDEINASGGVLGQKLQLTQYDIDTTPTAAEEATRAALAAKPFAVLGPQFSGITAASMKFTANPPVPQFTGGEASSLTRRFHPSLLRTSLSQSGSMPRLGALASFGLGARNVGLIWIDNDFGKDGRDALLSSFKRRNTTVGFDGSVQPAQADCSQVVTALLAAKVDALILYATETEAVEVLKELRKQGFNKPIVSDGLVASQKVVAAAGGAADGVLVHMNNSIDAPSTQMQAFVKRYEARFGSRPDLNGIKGYYAVQLLKAGLLATGEVDQTKFLNTVHNTRFESAKYPDLLGSVAYDFFGDLNRASYFAVIRNGRPQIAATISSVEGGMVELPNGQLTTLNSIEFRRELARVIAGSIASH